MPELTAEQLKQVFKDDPKGTSKTLADALRDFGYSTVTDEWVEKEVQRLLDGGASQGGPSMLLGRWLGEGVN